MINFLIKNLFELELWQKRGILICSDLIAISLSTVLALAARLESHSFIHDQATYVACGVSLIISFTIFYIRGFYNAVSRYFSVDAASTIIIACFGSAISVFSLVTIGGLQIPSSAPFIQATFCFVGLASPRFLIRVVGQNLNTGNRKNVGIYGAGAAGRQLLEALKWNNDYRVCLMVDDNTKLHGQNIGGIKVESFESALGRIKSTNLDTVLVAMPSASKEAKRAIFHLLTETNVRVKSIPDLSSLISGAAEISKFRDIDIEDLLGREAINPDTRLMAKTIKNKIVLVTGAGGSIGSELCRQIFSEMPKQLILLDISEFAIYTLLQELQELDNSIPVSPVIGSVQDRHMINNILGKFSIDTIFHAAAYKHVPLMEQNVMQCISNNVFGTLNVAEAATKFNVNHFIFVSTDKAVNPTNFMGASKRLAELICQAIATENHKTRFAIVRFGNVLGSSGSVVPLFKQQIAAGGPVTVTHENVTRYFMTIPEAAQLVIQAGAMGKDGEIFVLDMGNPVKIIELARKMIKLSGKNPIVDGKQIKGVEDVAIHVTGLRPGEKMFEELSHNANLTGTQQPRIMTTEDKGMHTEMLMATINKLRGSIATNDHHRLFEVISTIAKDIASTTTTTDIFLDHTTNRNDDSVISISQKSKKPQ